MAGTGPGGVFRGSAPSSNPLPFKIPFLTEKVPLPYTFNWWYIVPLWHTQFRTLHFSHLQTKMTDLPALSVISWDFLNISKSAKCLKKFPDICIFLLYSSTSKIPTFSYNWSLKKVSLSDEASPWRTLYKQYPLPRGVKITVFVPTYLTRFLWVPYCFCRALKLVIDHSLPNSK